MYCITVIYYSHHPQCGWHPATTTGPQQLGGVGEEVADELQCLEVSRIIHHKEAQAYYNNLHQQPLESHQRQTSRCRTDHQPSLGKTHPDYHCQGKLNKRFYIQKS